MTPSKNCRLSILVARRLIGATLIVAATAWLVGCGPYSSLFRAVLSIERNLAGVEARSVEVDGQTISYLERPGPGEVVLLIHGFASDKDNWTRFVRYLPERYRVIAPDLPGHGESSYDASRSYSAPAMTATLTHFVETLGVEKLHIAGNSLGGWIATLYTAQAPERVLSLSLIDSAGVVPPEPSELQLTLLKGENPLLVESPEDFETLLDFVFYREPFLPWPFRPELARVYAERAEINRKIWADVSAQLNDVLPLLDKLTMPVLVMWGEQDRVLHVSSVEIYERHLSDVRTVLIADSGHAPMTEVPELSAGFVARFMAGELAPGTQLRATSTTKLEVQSDERSR